LLNALVSAAEAVGRVRAAIAVLGARAKKRTPTPTSLAATLGRLPRAASAARDARALLSVVPKAVTARLRLLLEPSEGRGCS
jgi:hypothetical protein